MKSLNLKIIYRFLGLTAILNGIFMFIAVPFSVYYQEDATFGILNAGIVTAFLGLILYFFNPFGLGAFCLAIHFCQLR